MLRVSAFIVLINTLLMPLVNPAFKVLSLMIVLHRIVADCAVWYSICKIYPSADVL